MAVTAKLIVFPTGTLAHSPVELRIAAAVIGFLAFLVSGQKVVVGVIVPVVLLAAGLLYMGYSLFDVNICKSAKMGCK